MDMSSPSTVRSPIFDTFNDAGNLFNSSLGAAVNGVDLDRYNVGAGGLNILKVGDTSATIFVGSGDGDPNTGGGGGGEFVILGWVNLTLTRPSPRFVAPNTTKAVDFTTAGPGSTLTYTLKFANEGDQASTNTIIRDTIPTGTPTSPTQLV